jgi:hypothetical protein
MTNYTASVLAQAEAVSLLARQAGSVEDQRGRLGAVGPDTLMGVWGVSGDALYC